MRRLDLVIGPNGAGKSTFVRLALSRVLPPGAAFVNADEIAARRWPEDPQRNAYRASRVATETRLALMEADSPSLPRRSSPTRPSSSWSMPRMQPGTTCSCTCSWCPRSSPWPGWPGFEGFTFDHVVSGMVVGCRRDTKELFAVRAARNRVRTRVLLPGEPAWAAYPALPYETEIDRWQVRRRRRRPRVEQPTDNVVDLRPTGGG